MANPEHVARLREGVETWNAWRIEQYNKGCTARPIITGPNPSGMPPLMSIWRPDLSEADFSDQDLSKVNLNQTNLVSANFKGANLNSSYLMEAEVMGANLEGADLRCACAWGADARGANLTNATLVQAAFSQSNLSGSTFSGADLTEAVLHMANLRGADLRRAKFQDADLGEVNFHQANLSETDLTGARIYGTKFADVDLTNCSGLTSITHCGPSVLDFSTLARSGQLPLSFMRGCGLPDSLIDYLPSMLNQPVQFYSCFISFSFKDKEFADRLQADLQNKGVRCWFAPHDAAGGQKLHEQIDTAIRLHERVLLIVSKSSMNSEWVRTEIRKARKRELKEKCRVLFPIRLCKFDALRDWELFDADSGKDLAVEVREYYVPDFSTWKDHDCYSREFEKLLRDLKPKTGKVSG